MPPQPKLWKPRYSAECTREWKNARLDRKKYSKFYDAMCHYCGKNFLDVQSKEIHSATHFLNVRGKGIRCNTCMQWFEVGKPFYRHFLGTHTGHGFYCLLKRCGKGRTDKKAIVDHHYERHQYKEYTKLPRDYICETNFIRENLIEPPRGKDPDPDGTIARLLQPKVFLRRLCEDEIEFYSRHPCLYPVQTPINTLDVNKVEELREKLKEVCQNTRAVGASRPGVPLKSGVICKEKTRRFQRNKERKLARTKEQFEVNNVTGNCLPSHFLATPVSDLRADPVTDLHANPDTQETPKLVRRVRMRRSIGKTFSKSAVKSEARITSQPLPSAVSNVPVYKLLLSPDLVNSLQQVEIPRVDFTKGDVTVLAGNAIFDSAENLTMFLTDKHREEEDIQVDMQSM